MTKTGWFDLTINVTEETMRLLLSKQEWLFRLLNPFLCVVKLKLLLEAVIDSRFALAIPPRLIPLSCTLLKNKLLETRERQLS